MQATAGREIRPGEMPVAAGRPGEALARFWAARGRTVFVAAGAYWGWFSRLYHACLPFDAELDPDPAALAVALREANVLAVRWVSRSGVGVEGGAWFAPTAGYSLARVDTPHRRHVRRGLARCEIRPVTPEELAAQGRELNVDTLRRQRRADPELAEPRRWERFVAATCAVPEVAVLGAFHAGRLSAYAVSCRDGRRVHLLYKAARTADLPHGAAPALEFALLSGAAADPSIEGVGAGVPGPGDPLRDHFKEGLGYRLRPVRMGLALHPRARILASAPAVRTAATLARVLPRSERWQAVAGTLSAAREAGR